MEKPERTFGPPNTSLPPQRVLERFLSVSSLDPILPQINTKVSFLKMLRAHSLPIDFVC